MKVRTETDIRAALVRQAREEAGNPKVSGPNTQER